MPFAILAGAGLISSIVGGVGSAVAGGEAAGAQRYAADVQKQMYEETVQREAPFVSGGQNALTALEQGLGIGPYATGTGYGPLDAPFNPQDLAKTPGYQFTLGQGEQAILDTATARGGLGGGNTLKELTQYGQGLADTTFEQRLRDYMAQQQQALGALGGLTTLGSNAASNSATGASTFGANIGANLAGAGMSQAAGTLGVGNAIGGGINNLASNYLLSNAIAGSGGGGIDTSGLYGMIQPGISGTPPATLNF